jgi:cysteine-rich repeat protein
VHLLKNPFTRLRPRNWALRLFATAGLVAGMLGAQDVHATPAAFTFNAPNPGWVVALNGGVPVTDVEGDTAGARDIVGDAANPVLYIASDATHIYFRLRVDSDPLQNPTNFGPFGWGCLINTDADLTTFEWSTVVDGVNNPDTIYFYKNSVTTTPNDPQEAPDMPALNTTLAPLTAAVGHAQVTSAPSMFGGTADFFMAWAIDLTPLVAAGFNPANPANYYCGSANNGSNLGADCSGGSICGGLDAEFTDPIACGPLGCAICGDGQVGAAEGCDDGNLTNGDGCNSVCLKELGQMCTGSPTCASGLCDPAGNICACDESADCPAGQTCNLTPNPNVCVMAGCGNGVLDAGEGCDDGNTTANDGCNAVCLKELGQNCLVDMVCASGFCDPDGNLCACDSTADCPVPNVCNTVANPNMCVAPGCGNSVVDTGEGCDDGNMIPGDGCNAVCLIELLQGCTTSPSCASGLCDPMVNQCVCDMNSDCPSGQTCNTVLNPNACVPSGCGNGVLDPGEGCDDNNLNNGDGCNAQCLKELDQSCTMGNVCASGFCDAMKCACDADVDCPGFQICNTQANPNICVNPGCGNSVVEVGEGCDDGNTTSNDGCNNVCLLELGEGCTNSPSCASGLCDPNDATCVCDENADCPANASLCNLAADPNVCVAPGCANGLVEPGEGCDDGNMANNDGCNSACLLELGEVCPNGPETCASGFCDPVGTVCACDTNADCPAGQLCSILPTRTYASIRVVPTASSKRAKVAMTAT